MSDHEHEIENPLTSDAVTLDAASKVLAFANGTVLDIGPTGSLLSRAKRGEVDALEVEAIVFTQTDGKPNRKGVRVAKNALGAFAASFPGKPMLVDHRSYQQSARIGTILASSLEQSGNTASIRQKFRVVKQDAIVSVLDGTLDAFSIGFGRGDGAVVCSVHRTPVMENCYCWPLDKLEVDGEPKIVEYEFLSPVGDETSGVNVPAASGTRITDVRAALAAALSLSLPPAKDRPMKFALLAAALGIPALSDSDEATAVAAVNKLRGQLTAAEAGLEAMEQRATTAEAELAAVKPEITVLRTAAVDGQIERAYREGRLAAKRDATGKRIVSAVETSIRKLAAAMSPAELAAYIEEMPQIIPLNQRPISELHADKQERTHGMDNDPELGISDDVLATTAEKLGITVEEMKKTHAARAKKGR